MYIIEKNTYRLIYLLRMYPWIDACEYKVIHPNDYNLKLPLNYTHFDQLQIRMCR